MDQGFETDIMPHLKTFQYAKRLVDKYYTNPRSPTFCLDYEDAVLMGLTEIFIKKYLKQKYNRDFVSFFCYHKKKIFFLWEECIMAKYKLTVDIPYGRRSDYVDVVYQINLLVDPDGAVLLAANNNIYELGAVLIIQTNDHYDEILSLVKQAGLSLRSDKGLSEINQDAFESRKYNYITFIHSLSKEEFSLMYAWPFQFPEEKGLAQLGIKTGKGTVRKQLFISYCHQNTVIVNQVAAELTKRGVDFFLDTKDLLSGTPILRSILDGIAQSDVAVSFVSKDMAASRFCQTELDSILAGLVHKQNKWCFVKLDDVDVQTVFPMLHSYVYIDYHQNQSIDQIVEDIMRKLV